MIRVFFFHVPFELFSDDELSKECIGLIVMLFPRMYTFWDVKLIVKIMLSLTTTSLLSNVKKKKTLFNIILI